MIDDQDLMRALRRQDPSAGFAKRTLTRVATEAGARRIVQAWRSGPFLWTAAASIAACLVMVLGVAQFSSSHREASGRRAAEELTIALRITGERLHDVRDKLTKHATVSGGAQKDHK